MPRALITGITGGDGSYLAERLLGTEYEVCGVVRRSSTEDFERVAHLRDRLQLAQADLFDHLSLIDLVNARSRTRSITWRRNRLYPHRGNNRCLRLSSRPSA